MSAFTGIGGFELGFGEGCVAQIEINRHRQRVLEEHFPGLLKGENIDDVCGDELGPDIDAFIGGFPCQETSIAAPHRPGLAGERSGLFWSFHRLVDEYFRLVERANARWVVIENPEGLLRSPGRGRDGTDRTGWDMAAVVRGLEDLGYGWAYRVVDGRHLGSTQRRRRVLIVGHRGGDPGPAWQVLGDDGAGGEAAAAGAVGRRPRGPQAVVGPAPDSGVLIFRKSARARASLAKGGYETWVPEGADGSTNTLTGFDGGMATRQTHLVLHDDGRMRTLTLGEWERLQGFPVDWTASMPTSQRYSALGDAMNVDMARWLGRRLKAIHAQIPMLRSA